jgi:hypothetical protein
VPEPAHEPVTLDLDHVRRLWPQAMEQLAEARPPLFSMLEDAGVLRAGDGVVAIGVGSAMRAGMVDKPDQRAALEDVLARVLGRRVRVEVAVAEAAAPLPPGPARGSRTAADVEALRQEVIQIFDAVEEPGG